MLFFFWVCLQVFSLIWQGQTAFSKHILLRVPQSLVDRCDNSVSCLPLFLHLHLRMKYVNMGSQGGSVASEKEEKHEVLKRGASSESRRQTPPNIFF